MPEAFVYVLQSQRNGGFYIGCSADVTARLATHNSGVVKATKYLLPWTLVYTELCSDMTAARKREWQLKRLKSRVAIERLISASGG